jgi:hypothetical protein
VNPNGKPDFLPALSLPPISKFSISSSKAQPSLVMLMNGFFTQEILVEKEFADKTFFFPSYVDIIFEGDM